jgi:LCP family protein required for cell wall assembly
VNPERPAFERPPRPGQEPPNVARTRRFSPPLIFGIALFAVAAFYVLLVVATMADDIFFPGNEIKIGINLPGVDSGKNPEVADINERINILFLGLDRRVGIPEHTAARTDSVFILTIDPFSKTAGVFSIPRDLAVDIPDGSGGYITDRINVAWEMGEFTYDGYPGGGPGLIKDTIEDERNFDIPIDYYVILDFADFIALVDEVGGVDIDVPEYAVDYSYSDCEGCLDYAVEFVPGMEHMDGQRALAYARIRKSDNDFKRIERQQLVIRATADKALSLDLFVPPTRALDLYRKYKDAVQTDIPDLLVPGLAKLAQQVGSDNLNMVSIASATYPCGSGCPGAVLLADWDKVEELKAQVFGDGKIQSEGALVELLNGTDDPGLAERFAAFLRKQGIPAEDLLVEDAATLYSRSLIVDRGGKEYTAKKLADWLNLRTDRIVAARDPDASPFADATGDIVVVLGSDARLSTAAVPSGD